MKPDSGFLEQRDKLAGNAGEQPARGAGLRAALAAKGGSPAPPRKRAPSPARPVPMPQGRAGRGLAAHVAGGTNGRPRGRGRGVRGRAPAPGAVLHLTQEHKSADRATTLLKLNALLVGSLRKVGLDRLASMVEACHRGFAGWGCDKGHRWAIPDKTCQNRLCAFEMRARAMRNLHRFEKPLSELVDGRYLVLSERNVPLGELAAGLETLWAAFERLRHVALWAAVRGAIAVLEITFNCKARTWHPHLNVIFDGPFLAQERVVREWEKATRGRGEIVWITRLDSPVEAFKYVTKLADIADVPEAVEEFLRATKNVRFLRTYGSLYRLPVEEALAMVCPDCGTRNVQRLGFVPFEGVELDAQGVLRFDGSFLVDASAPVFSKGPPVPLPPVEGDCTGPEYDKAEAWFNEQIRLVPSKAAWVPLPGASAEGVSTV